MLDIKKSFITPLLLVTGVASLNADATQGIDIGADWKVSGNLKVGYVNYDYSYEKHRPTDGIPILNRGHVDSRGVYETTAQ